MPRKASTSLFQIHCYSCKEKTVNGEPITIKKNPSTKDISNNYYIQVNCTKCNMLKSKKLNKNEIAKLPKEILDAAVNTSHTEVLRDGKAFPLLTLLPSIISGIASLAPTVIDFIKSKTGGELIDESIKERSLKDIYNGGEISQEELKDMLQILQGLGYESLV